MALPPLSVRSSVPIGPWRIDLATSKFVNYVTTVYGLPVVDSFFISVPDAGEAVSGGRMFLGLVAPGAEEPFADQFIDIPDLEPGQLVEIHTPGLSVPMDVFQAVEDGDTFVLVAGVMWSDQMARTMYEIDAKQDLNWIDDPACYLQMAAHVDPEAYDIRDLDTEESFASVDTANDLAIATTIHLEMNTMAPVPLPEDAQTVGFDIRKPGFLFRGTPGNHLDLATLWASIAEKVGLSPVLLFIRGECFPGYWARMPEGWPPLVRYKDAVAQAIDNGDLVIFDWFDDDSDEHPVLYAGGSEVMDGHNVMGLLSIGPCREAGLAPIPKPTFADMHSAVLDGTADEATTKHVLGTMEHLKEQFSTDGEEPEEDRDTAELMELLGLIPQPDGEEEDEHADGDEYDLSDIFPELYGNTGEKPGDEDDEVDDVPESEVPVFAIAFPEGSDEVSIDLDDLLESDEDRAIRIVKQIANDVIREFGPVPEEVLTVYVADYFEGEVDDVLEDHEDFLDDTLGDLEPHESFVERFHWPEGIDPETWRGYRSYIEAPEDQASAIRHLAIEELINAVVDGHPGGRANTATLLRTTLNAVGLNRLTRAVEERIREAIDEAYNADRLEWVGGEVYELPEG